MKAGVICEFNPFHNGHKFLFEKIKSSYADEVICVMSGSFVQRGDIAVTDKFSRTSAALMNGADMVVELPTAYAVAPAQVFADSGVRLAYELGCEKLCFGAENSIEELYGTIDALDSAEAQGEIAALMREGTYYPRALSEAVGEKHDGILSKPNNILAVEYIRACRRYGLEPVAVPREGVCHDSRDISGNIASGSMIRELIRGGEPYSAYVPFPVTNPSKSERIEPITVYKLKTMSPDAIAGLAEVSEGLENRIFAVSKEYNSLSEILNNIKTKRYTMARLRRTATAALLGINKDIRSTPVPYIRVLGVKKERKHLIASRSLPLIVDVRSGYDKLDISAEEIFDIDLRATELMNIASDTALNDFSEGLIVI